MNIAKREGKPTRRLRIDKDGVLAKSYGFNKLLVSNDIQMETTAGNGSKLNKIIERPKRDHYAKTRIALGIQAVLGTQY